MRFRLTAWILLFLIAVFVFAGVLIFASSEEPSYYDGDAHYPSGEHR